MRTRTPSAVVIIPAYNAAQTIHRTLASALASAVAAVRYCTETQGLAAEIDIVVVNDCSTDRTVEVVADWVMRGQVRLLSNAINKSAGASRNEGVRQTTGSFLFFLDADDIFYPNHIHACLSPLLADDSLGYVFTRLKLDMPIHHDWRMSMDESCPINFYLRRVWHDMIGGFPEEPDFRTYGTEDTLYRMCLRRLVQHKKLDVETCEQFVSPGNALDRQRAKLSMSVADWKQSGVDDRFVLTAQMEAVATARLEHIAKLRGGGG